MSTPNFSFKEAINSEAFRNTDTLALPILLGSNNGAFVADLAKMPHLLIGGRKGTGKTNFLHGLILSLLCKKSPEQLKFVLINPKPEEYACYNETSYLLTPVISSNSEAVNSLLWCKTEMERRYSLLRGAEARDIIIYNERVKDENKLPYIVIIIDEFSKILKSEYKENFKDYVQIITQKSRAVGIHLIMATSKVNKDIILPIFKANISSRIAFSTKSDIESKIILERNGAENLVEVGDVLCSLATSDFKLTHVQTAFITNRMIAKIGSQVNIESNISYTDLPRAEIITPKKIERDELVSEALDYFTSGNPISIFELQRQFGIGFNRAVNIMDWLESEGVISDFINGKRELLKTKLD